MGGISVNIVLVNKSSTRTSRVPLKLCVLIISHFLAFSNFMDCVIFSRL